MLYYASKFSANPIIKNWSQYGAETRVSRAIRKGLDGMLRIRAWIIIKDIGSLSTEAPFLPIYFGDTNTDISAGMHAQVNPNSAFSPFEKVEGRGYPRCIRTFFRLAGDAQAGVNPEH
jgi:hypothetical protein